LRDQRAAFREALAYEVMAELGLVAPRVRRAHIEYRDTSPPNPASMAGWQLDRDAFILEDIEVVGERLGGRALDDQELEELADAGFAEELVTALRLLHALLGNWDFTLSLDGHEHWNTDVISLPSGQLIPVAGDFDLASWVTGVVRLSARGITIRSCRSSNGKHATGSRHPGGGARFEFRGGAGTLRLAEAAIESAVAGAAIDTAGRTNAKRHATRSMTRWL
jgi:hypothetical protein